jgi:hypothetical protein
MKILSIDVGIKNLAICLFEQNQHNEEFRISKWEVINLADKETFACCKLDKNKHCTSPAKYKKEELFFCTKHAKKEPFHLPFKELKPSYVKKQTLQKLIQIAVQHGISYKTPAKKDNLIETIQDYYYTHCFQEIITENASKIDLINISINIKNKLNELFADVDSIEHIIIENQISNLASRMKTIQGMLVQYFVMSDIYVDNIEFVSARNKLKDVFKDNNCEKVTYNTRKKMSINKCLEIITNDYKYADKIDFYKNHKKKDDLADTFLQGLWFIKEKIYKIID